MRSKMFLAADRCMMGMPLLLIVALCLGSPLSFGDPLPEGKATASKKWERIYSEDGIVVYKREVPGSDLLAVRGETVLHHPREKVLSFMIDHTKRHLWVDRLKSISRIQEIDGFLDAISYYQVDLPWPVKDRDFVVRTRIWYNQKTDTIHSDTHSVKGKVPLDPNYVRAFSHNSTVKLRQDPSGGTKIVVEARIDPRGAIPMWLTNYMQKRWAYHTLLRLDDILKKTPVEVSPVYSVLLGHADEIGTTMRTAVQ